MFTITWVLRSRASGKIPESLCGRLRVEVREAARENLAGDHAITFHATAAVKFPAFKFVLFITRGVSRRCVPAGTLPSTRWFKLSPLMARSGVDVAPWERELGSRRVDLETAAELAPRTYAAPRGSAANYPYRQSELGRFLRVCGVRTWKRSRKELFGEAIMFKLAQAGLAVARRWIGYGEVGPVKERAGTLALALAFQTRLELSLTQICHVCFIGFYVVKAASVHVIWRRRGCARPADGSTGNVPPSNARHPLYKDTHTPAKCTTENRASTGWIGLSPNRRSCRVPSVKNRHGKGKRGGRK